MSVRFLVPLALAAGIGGAAAAQEFHSSHFGPGAAAWNRGVVLQRGGAHRPGIRVWDTAGLRTGPERRRLHRIGAFDPRADRRRMHRIGAFEARADRRLLRAHRGARWTAVPAARRGAHLLGHRGHARTLRPSWTPRRAGHGGVVIAGVGDLRFGIEDHHHRRGRDGLERHRDRDRFRVPLHRPPPDRFGKPKLGFGDKRDIGNRRIGRDRHFKDRRKARRRLRCDTALGASVLAFC